MRKPKVQTSKIKKVQLYLATTNENYPHKRGKKAKSNSWLFYFFSAEQRWSAMERFMEKNAQATEINMQLLHQCKNIVSLMSVEYSFNDL